MSNELWILITLVRKEDMELLQYVHMLNTDTEAGQNYMYWKEKNIAMYFLEVFDFDEEVEILDIKTINGVK